MTPKDNTHRHKLSVVIPCFNEEKTLETCVGKVLALSNDDLGLEIVIVNDCSVDRSLEIARKLESRHPEIVVLHHEKNQGKGAALRTGFKNVTGDFVAVQDADLEYDPRELRDLVQPLKDGHADVVIGSRFKGRGPHRVLYFWHSVGNAILTLLSNMFTDLNLTDMETCYKVFKREVIQGIEIEEKRFGFEPEIVAKIAHSDLRIYEMAISYSGRTYEEGKKITWKDGVRALYCIFRYNSHHLPLPIKFLAYLSIGAAAAIVNLICFLLLIGVDISLKPATIVSFIIAATVNYVLCIALLFRHRARWNSLTEMALYLLVVAVAGVFDFGTTSLLYTAGLSAGLSKALSSVVGVVVNFIGRQFVVFGNG
jgi:glycosyltransferase involved in cell wall biosynthesis